MEEEITINLNIGERVEITNNKNKKKFIGYLRKIDNNYYTIQSQKGYLKILPILDHTIKIIKKKCYRNQQRVLFENILSSMIE